jgi:hypothetical protein
MAARPQYTVQIMEDSTQFNLEASIRKWSDDLAAQPALTPESRNELETHLRDTVKELCGLGINPEEAFWLACRRVGLPSQLAEEYAKENPNSISKTRIIWAALVVLSAWILQGVLAGIGGALGVYELRHLPWTETAKAAVRHALIRPGMAFMPRHWAFEQVPKGALWWVDGIRGALQNPETGFVLGACGAILLAFLISRCPTHVTGRVWRLFFSTRLRFVMVAGLCLFTILALEWWSEAISHSILIADIDSVDYVTYAAQLAYFRIPFPTGLIIFIAWMIPPQGKANPSKPSWHSRFKRA